MGDLRVCNNYECERITQKTRIILINGQYRVCLGSDYEDKTCSRCDFFLRNALTILYNKKS